MANSLEIILPVFNEAEILKKSALKVKDFLEDASFKFMISIVDNGSVDETFKIAKDLENRFSTIAAFRLEEKGRGRALKFRILNSSCRFVGFMDIDLSANLLAFLDMYENIQKDYDMIIASRLHPDSSVTRSLIRECLSRIYSKAVMRALNLPFLDYQCGLKLFKKENVLPLLSLTKNDNWFFDTELIFRAYKKGLRIKEIPVEWNERRMGRVKIFPTIIEDIKGIMRLRFNNEL